MNSSAWVARRRRAPFEPTGERKDSAPRFTRFAAAMEAAPPPAAQVLLEDQTVPPAALPAARSRPIVVKAGLAAPKARAASEATQSNSVAPEYAAEVTHEGLMPGIAHATEPTDGGAVSQPVIPRRAGVDDGNGSRVPWLGLSSWLLLCAALFASLIWPSQASFDRMAQLASFDRVSELWTRGFADVDVMTQPEPEDPAPVQSAALPPSEPAWSTLPEADAVPEVLPPTELAPPIGSAAERTIKRLPGGPPLPQFKPIDGVAAKFSNAFFEIGERLQKEGDADAASYMRRQGNNLEPWRLSTGSEL